MVDEVLKHLSRRFDAIHAQGRTTVDSVPTTVASAAVTDALVRGMKEPRPFSAAYCATLDFTTKIIRGTTASNQEHNAPGHHPKHKQALTSCGLEAQLLRNSNLYV
jgi:hypothetical protein